MTTTPTQSAPPAPTGELTGRRGWASFVAATATSMAAAATVAAVDPHQPGHYPTCPFLWATGGYCPGCGSLRALHDGLHGDLPGALARNPLAVVAAPFVLFAWVCWALRIAGYDAPHPTRLHPRWVWALLGVVLAYWVLRNVPGWTWLSPA